MDVFESHQGRIAGRESFIVYKQFIATKPPVGSKGSVYKGTSTQNGLSLG